MTVKERFYEDPEIGVVLLRKSGRSRRISLRINPRKGVTVSVPYLVPYDSGLRFFLSKRDWVLKTLSKQKEKIGAGSQPSEDEIEVLRVKAKEELPRRLAELAETYSFSYNSVRIKHNSSNWGSCSRKGNINLNLNLIRVSDELRDYVLLHELCHLRIPNHGPEFHILLESLCPDHRSKEKELRKYRLL